VGDQPVTELTEENVLGLLTSGSTQARIDFLQSLPPNGFKSAAASLIASDNPGMVVVALGPLIQEYSYGANPQCGAVLAAAAHQRAVDLWESGSDHGLIPTTLSGLACSHVKALTLLGRSEEVLEATSRYIPYYRALEEEQNLPSLEVLRIEALVNLQRIDEAHAALQDEALLNHPISGLEARRLKGWIDRYRADPATLKSQSTTAPEPPSAEELLDIMKTAIGIGFEGKAGQALKQQVDQLDQSNRLDPNDPEQFKHLLRMLDQSEAFLTKGGGDSELTVRSKVRNATAIFVHGTPPQPVIQNSLKELGESLVWAKEHGIVELENDAWWGIYLCNSRMDRPSEAADALIQLRGNLEGMRRGISDPLKRGGIFTTYRYLFNVLCEKLQQAGRATDLLEAIESSKGRVIADRLTEQTGDVVEDAAIYGSVRRLPGLTQRENFHYLTYFVDEESVYASLVSKQGTIHAIDPIAIKNTELRSAAETVDPEQWGNPIITAPGSRIPNVSDLLAPLVAWLDDLLDQGIVAKDDHICYSSDEDFHNVPLQYLRFRDGILLDWFSFSRAHSAFHVDRLLSREASAPPEQYFGIVVPLREDLDKKDGDAFLANLDAPQQWLEAHGRTGHAVRLEEATLARVEQEALDHRVVHFSTHGWFPEQETGNPYYDSYLVLADEQGLPDMGRVTGGQYYGKLTPSTILDANLDLAGSHISVMACVSGLAKEGLAGDTLGLDWAFIQAGASSLISTHWKVSAACAAKFFELFYEMWVDVGQSRASACRSAMMKLLGDDRTPESLHRWAAFSLTGDFR
jgi:hypothetical protein